jgi:hypothetical protein
LGRFLSVDPVLNVKRALRNPQNWNRYAYVMNNPLNYIDPTGKDVSIRLNFSGDGWTDEQKKQILAQVTQWYQKQNVGKVFVFDGANKSHGRLFGNLLRGHTSMNVTSGTGTGAHKPGMVFAGNYFGDKSLNSAQQIRAISNTIIHETAAHKFGSTYLGSQDQLFYLRNIAIAQQDEGLRARYGTVADSYAFDQPDTRGNVTNGPIPIHPGDLRRLQQHLGPVDAEPPEDD